MLPTPDVDDLRRLLRRLTAVLVVVAAGALVFTCANVTLFAKHHGVPLYIAWLLDPLVGVSLGAVLLADGALVEYGVRPGGPAACLRWFAGVATWLMNVWTSLWPTGAAWGVPVHIDPAGTVLHSVPPVLLIVLAEAITRYRVVIQERIRYALDTSTAQAPAAAAFGSESTAAPVTSPAPQPEVAPVPEPSPEPEPEPEEEETPRLSTEDAARVIEEGWRDGLSIRETATRATRSPSYVHRQYGELDKAAAEAAAGDVAEGGDESYGAAA